MLTEEERRRLLLVIAEAKQHVFDLAAGRKQWRMCVPVQPDDSDSLLCKALDEFQALVTRLAAANPGREEIEEIEEAHARHHDNGYCYGDSHAEFMQKIERARLAAARPAPEGVGRG